MAMPYIYRTMNIVRYAINMCERERDGYFYFNDMGDGSQANCTHWPDTTTNL